MTIHIPPARTETSPTSANKNGTNGDIFGATRQDFYSTERSFVMSSDLPLVPVMKWHSGFSNPMVMW